VTYGTGGASMRGGPAVGDSKANLEAKGWHVFESLLDPDLTGAPSKRFDDRLWNLQGDAN
jgi:hypothetical protein